MYGKTGLGGKLLAYDGRKSLYTAGSFPFSSMEFEVKYVDPEKEEEERSAQILVSAFLQYILCKNCLATAAI